nr:unnamed protein product [Callosobruchus chinensis]
METWRIGIHLKAHMGRGIFLGDSLRSLWFCQFSNIINNTDYGFSIRHQKVNQCKINHFLYINDIEIYAATEVQLRELLRATRCVHGFSSSFHNINAGVPQGSVLARTWFLLHINDLFSSTTNPIHSFADDSTLHAGIMSNRPISVAELERRRLATTASLSKDLEAIAAWGLKDIVEFNASKTQYCTLSNKRCPCEHSVLMNNQALPRSHSFKLLGVSITENMIWHEHVSSIATAAGKKLGYLFRARKYFSPSNLLTL